MRFVPGVLSVLWVLAPATVRADDKDACRALADKAIRAAGGEAKLTKLHAVTFKHKGLTHLDGNDVATTGEWSAQAGGKFRWTLEGEVNGNPASVLVVLNADNGWVQGNGGDTNDLPKELRQALREDFESLRMAELLTPLRDKSVTLSPLGELKVKGRPAVGMKVSRKAHPDVDLFFDKQTGLPVRVGLRVKENDSGQEANHELLLSDYQEVDGVRHFTKMVFVRDGKDRMEMELSDIQLKDKLDDGLFDKP